MDRAGELLAFRDLFSGRDDAWGIERGGCIRRTPNVSVWWGHLYGRHPIGTYNAEASGLCRWSAIDFDDDDLTKALDAAEAYRLFGCHPFVERSRSKGWHVWIFHESPVPLRLARRAGLGVLNVLDFDMKTEVYPKQMESVPGVIGNYLRLPYPWVDRDRGLHRKVVIEGEALDLATFLDVVERTPAEGLERLGELAPTERSHAISDAARAIAASMGGSQHWPSSQDIAAVAAGTERIHVGDRDNSFWCLAKFLHGTGRTQDEATAIALRVLATQTDDGFSESVVLEKIRRAYRAL